MSGALLLILGFPGLLAACASSGLRLATSFRIALSVVAVGIFWGHLSGTPFVDAQMMNRAAILMR